MSTLRMSFVNLLVPDGSGNVYWQPAAVLDTNDLWPTDQVLIFTDGATKVSSSCHIPVPKNYVGTAKIGLRWKTTLTSNDVVWDVDYRSVAVGESADQATFQESLTVTDTAAGTANWLNDAEVTLTSANLAVDDSIYINISRDGTDGADTMAGSAQLVDAWFEYVDS